jgi:GNAT superfamily N-acetyltransferase
VPDVEELTGPVGARVAGEVLGRAFVDDPVWSWVVRGAGREHRMTQVFGAFAATATRHDGARLLTTRERSAVAVWLPPGGWRTGLGETLRVAWPLVRGLRGGVARALRLESVVVRHHLQEPHWYLEALGALPEARGTGVGGRVLQPVLDRCDHEGLPAYLESSNPRNWSFYERHGFRRLELLPMPTGAPLMLAMRRDPR